MALSQTIGTFPQLLRAAVDAHGDAIAIRQSQDDHDGESLSHRELDARSASLAKWLIARGAGKGSRIGFMIGNCPQFLVVLAAIARIGAVAIPLSTMIRGQELVRILRHSDVAGVIVQRRLLGHDLLARLCDALPQLRTAQGPDLRIAEVPYLRWILSTGADLPGAVADMDRVADARPVIADDLLRAIEGEVHATDQMIEIYTSGSMALPKGVRHNHGPMIFRTRYLRRMLDRQAGTESRVPLPMFWVGGMMMYLLPNLAAGVTTVCTWRTHSDSRYAIGSVLSDDDLETLERAQAKPIWGLGMSETLGPYSYSDAFRAVGFPLCAPMDHFADGFEVRVVDAENRPVADGEVGEMQVRGYPVTPGLHKVERAEAFTADGFLRTGDQCLVEGARIHFVGRGGEMVKTAGSNVSPAEVELELQAIDGVDAAYVVGLPDTQRGQVLAAAVIAREGRALDFTAIEGHLRARLSGYKVPRAWIEMNRDEVPMLHSNKVARRQIADLVARRLGRT